jgi:alpha-glucosidase
MSFQSASIVSPGKVLEVQKLKNGGVGQSNNAKFRITFLNASIVNVKFSRHSEFEDFSYAVVKREGETSIEFTDSAASIKFKSDHLTVSVNKENSCLSFFDSGSRLLNMDEPGLGTSWNGEQVMTYKKLFKEERFIGLGEKTGPLDRRGQGYQNWNTDVFSYGLGSDPLYCTIPFYIGIHENGVYGIFLDNSHKSFFNFGASNNRFSSFGADAGEMNYYFIQGETVAELIQRYTWLTGTMELPPIWSLGYQQCRYSYYPDKEVATLASTFRDKNIPADAIVLDIHYMDAYKIFTWHPKHFSKPEELINRFKSLGFEIVLMCDPGIKSQAGYGPYDDGIKSDVFIKYPDGENYSGEVWPGWCHFPDFTKPTTREWWGKWLETYSDLGVQGYWNDMNEIATWGQMLPENLVFNFEGNISTSRRGRNVYGLMMAKSTFESARKNLKGKRPFNLTRSGFSGVQRYAAVWTGDNVSYDEHMMLGVRLVNSMGLSGIAFAGYDVGGFVGDASPKLFARWITLGAFSPFFRAHTMINSRDSEPWSFGEETEQISRNYIQFRYKLLPYLYSCFYEASKSGMPIQRSLAIEYPLEEKVYLPAYHHQYMFGRYIMVAPVESNKELVKVFLPEGVWYYLFTGKKYEGNQEIAVECPVHKLPVFIKGGAIIPMKDVGENTRTKSDNLYIHVYQGAGVSEFNLYMDDGETYDYQSGKYSLRAIKYSSVDNTIVIGKSEGQFTPGIKTIKVILHSFVSSFATTGSKQVSLKKEKLEFFLPLEKFDPLYEPDTMGEEEILSFELPFTNNEVTIQLNT